MSPTAEFLLSDLDEPDDNWSMPNCHILILKNLDLHVRGDSVNPNHTYEDEE